MMHSAGLESLVLTQLLKGNVCRAFVSADRFLPSSLFAGVRSFWQSPNIRSLEA